MNTSLSHGIVPHFVNVFISSAYTELVPFRQATIDAAWRADLYPDGMERENCAKPFDTGESSRRMVDRAHVYIGLFAHRYSPLTVQELRWAQARKIPILPFIAAAPLCLQDVEPDPEKAQKLVELKAELRATYTIATFTSQEELADKVFRSLQQLKEAGLLWWGTDEHSPATAITPALATPYRMVDGTVPHAWSTTTYYRDVVADMLSHYTQHFIGRKYEIDAIISLTIFQRPYYLLIEGPAGFGKTALVAQLVNIHETGQWPSVAIPNLLYYFIRQDAQQNTSLAFLQAVNTQLLALLNRPIGVCSDLFQLRVQFADLWQTASKLASAECPLLLIVDGLDEMAQEAISIAEVLPRGLDPFIHVVVTSRPNPEPTHQVALEHPLTQAKRIQLRAFGSSEIEEFLHPLIERGNATPEETGTLVDLVLRLTHGEPLFVRFVCLELISAGSGLKQTIVRLERHPPSDVQEYFHWQFRQLDEAAHSDVAWDVLGLLAVALGSMSVAEMAEALQLPRAHIQRALKPLRRFLLGRKRYGLMHSQLRAVVADELSTDDKGRLEGKLLALCKVYKNRGWPPGTLEYVIRYSAQHFYNAGQMDELYSLMSKHWLDLHIEITGSHRTFIDDVSLAIAAARSADPPDWFQLATCSFIFASYTWLADAIPEQVFGALAGLGQISRALDLVSLIQDASYRHHVYTHMLDAMLTRDDWEDEKAVLEEAYRIAEQCKSEKYITEINRRLAKYMGTGQSAPPLALDHNVVSHTAGVIGPLLPSRIGDTRLVASLQAAESRRQFELRLEQEVVKATYDYVGGARAERLGEIGQSLIVLREYAAAMPVIERALSLQGVLFESSIASALHATTLALSQRGEITDASTLARRTISVIKGAKDRDIEEASYTLASMVKDYIEAGLLSDAIDAADAIPDPSERINQLGRLALTLADMARTDHALQVADRVLSSQVEPLPGLVYAHLAKARAYYALAETEERQVHASHLNQVEAIRLAKQFEDELDQAEMLGSVSLTLAHMGALDMALQAALGIPDERRQSFYLGKLARAIHPASSSNSEIRDVAIRAAAEATNAAHRTPYYAGRAAALADASLMWADIGRRAQSLAAAVDAIRTLGRVRNTDTKLRVIGSLVVALVKIGEYARAEFLARRVPAETYRDQLLLLVEETRCGRPFDLLGLTATHLSEKDLDEVIAQLSKSVDEIQADLALRDMPPPLDEWVTESHGLETLLQNDMREVQQRAIVRARRIEYLLSLLKSGNFDQAVGQISDHVSRSYAGYNQEELLVSGDSADWITDLCTLAARLLALGERERAIRSISDAFDLARPVGVLQMYHALERAMPVIASLESANTVGQMCEKFLEVRRWWSRDDDNPILGYS